MVVTDIHDVGCGRGMVSPCLFVSAADAQEIPYRGGLVRLVNVKRRMVITSGGILTYHLNAGGVKRSALIWPFREITQLETQVRPR